MSLKQKIIDESLKLFSLKGFLNTSIQDILKAANSSKGGFYHHFKSKEDLFFQVLDEARKIWREKNLFGIDQTESGVEKIRILLKNFKDRYLMDAEHFPGGCVFITLAVELSDQDAHLAKELEKGFVGLKKMIKRFLEKGKASGELRPDIDTDEISEILFNSILGTSVSYSTNKSTKGLNKSVSALNEYLKKLRP